MSFVKKLWRRGQNLLPVTGLHFTRPLVLFQSDDWGRVGLRDREGLEELQAAGLVLGEQPYDFYTLETAEDLAALNSTLKVHRDSSGRHPCMQMNFIVANLDFGKMSAEDFRQILLLPLSDGLPRGWRRPGLIEAYHEGISDGVFHPALHGATHFCPVSMQRNLSGDGERSCFIRMLWQAGTPYIFWRAPWIGYEYWDPEKPEDKRFLPIEIQRQIIGRTVGAFAKLFQILPGSACAPGYRANDDTHSAWSQHGIRVAQSGPGSPMPPHFDRNGVLHLSRTVEFEPAVDANFSVAACVRHAEAAFARGVPAVVSVHSINFHSTVKDFRSRSLRMLDEFLTVLESRHSDLLYLYDEELHELVTRGSCEAWNSHSGTTQVKVIQRKFTRAEAVRQREV
jgi:hypothetical protein